MNPQSTLSVRIPIAALFLAAASVRADAHVGLDAPNGGEILIPATVVTIEWHVEIAHTLENWDLSYSTSGDAGPWIPIAIDLPPGSPDVGVPHFFDWTVPDTPSDEVRVRVVMDNAGTDYDDISDDDLVILSSCSAPTNYCSAAPNSTGAGATLGHLGSLGIAANDFVLTVASASANQPGLFFYGPEQVQAPFGDGFRCVGAGAVGVFRLGPPNQTDAAGDSARPLDLTQPPADSGPGSIAAGDTWNFQFWYRDPAAGGAGFNLSDGLSATFCP